MKNIAVMLFLLLLAACASTTKTDSSQISQSSKTNSSSAKTNPEVIKSSKPDMNADVELRKLAAEKLAAEKLAAEKLAAEIRDLQKQSVYFDFDKYVVKPEYLEVIRKQAEFVKAHNNDFVTVEGNADERGSTEYNLALGDRRANAARKNLELLGVPATQINTVSFGEGKPRLSCHEEKCWKENRRDDFVHKLN